MSQVKNVSNRGFECNREVAGISGSSAACRKESGSQVPQSWSLEERCLFINRSAAEYEFFPSPKRDLHEDQNSAWRISPEPFWIDAESYAFLEALGDRLLHFYEAVNLLYQHSGRGLQPAWVAEYLELGKPDRVIEYGQMNRFKRDLPVVIRPDIIYTPDGAMASELDSVPGGIGLQGFLGRTYSQLGYPVVGGPNGMIDGFRDAVYGVSGSEDARDQVLGIVVSDESSDYRPEMTWVGDRLRDQGRNVYNLTPDDLVFAGEHLYADGPRGRERLDILYRFFELFDLKNIPQIDLILYAIRKESVRVTPPLKSYLEEKLLFALLHHPQLESYWLGELGKEDLQVLRQLFPQSWVMDNRPVPPHAVIPGLSIDGKPVTRWDQFKEATKSQRRYVIKPSGFSDLAWGSRGVVIGHDSSQDDWSDAVDNALASFPETPHVFQKFHKGAKYDVQYYDFWRGEIRSMKGRVRLTPYYFVAGNKTRLGGIMATVTPLNKKLIHGMTDAVMAPVAVREV